jgi:hypothetical protein
MGRSLPGHSVRNTPCRVCHRVSPGLDSDRQLPLPTDISPLPSNRPPGGGKAAIAVHELPSLGLTQNHLLARANSDRFVATRLVLQGGKQELDGLDLPIYS